MKKEKNNNEQQHLPRSPVMLNHVAWKGPIPPPQMMQEYNRIIPGAAERILTMAEDNSRHMIEFEKKQQQYDYKVLTRGQHYSLSFIVMLFSVAVVLAFLGHPLASSIMGSFGIASVVSAFMIGHFKNKNLK